jgi:hypothetical protein
MTTETRRAVPLLLKHKRIGFVDLAEARSINGGKPVFGVRIIIDPTDPDAGIIDRAITEVATTQWKDKAKPVLDMLYDKGRVAFLKKDYRNLKGDVYKGFEGMYSLGASSPQEKQPTCFDEFGKPLDAAGIRRKLYSGCFAHVKVEIYPLLRDDGNRISCAVLGVVFAADGEPFGGGSAVATADDFEGLFKGPIDMSSLSDLI